MNGDAVGTYNDATHDVTYRYDQNHSSSNRSRGQLTQVSNSSYTKWHYYNAQGLLATETSSIYGAPQNYTTHYGYDAYLRPSTITYPDNEVVTTYYNSMGLPAKLHSSQLGDIVDGAVNVSAVSDAVNYDEAGRAQWAPGEMRMPYGTDLWRQQKYHGWTTNQTHYEGNGNGRLATIYVGTIQGSAGAHCDEAEPKRCL